MIDNKELNKIFIQPNFQFYQSHEFQKLNQNLSSNRTFSIFHTNTCFKNENLDLLLNNLEHSFDISLASATLTLKELKVSWPTKSIMVPKKYNNPNILIAVFYRHTKKTSDNIFLENLMLSLSESKNKNKQLSSVVTSIMTQ